jgi:hypothetical protein
MRFIGILRLIFSARLFALRQTAFAATVPARQSGKTRPFQILFNRFFGYFAEMVGRFGVAVEQERHAC